MISRNNRCNIRLSIRLNYIDDCAYSNIANMAADDEKLVAVKTIYTNDLQRIAKIQLILFTIS